MFFLKKKPIVINAYCSDPTVFHLCKPTHAKYFYPEWWKQIPKTVKMPGSRYDISTVKSCRGIIDYYKNGIVLPLWHDAIITVGSSTKQMHAVEMAAFNQAVETLPPNQWNGWISDNKWGHIKFNSPWVFTCDEFVQFAFTDPAYNRDNLHDYYLLPGIVDYRYQTSTNINIMVEYRDKEREFLIPAGQPMVNIVPLTDREIVIKHHLVTVEEKRKYMSEPVKFRGVYNFFKSKTKEIEAREKSKCPFGFGKK